ncbi:MAG: CoA pyrophosphatase [Syntrophales bacterium]|nr:CoA pyrophosphatase [Syntrophales bacterium]
MLQKDMTPFSPDFLKSRLSLDPPPPEPPPGLQPAGVLAPVFFVDTTPHLLFTKRTLTVRDHRGQISFPGGVRSSKDPHLLATALRETEEEIGLTPGNVEVLGSLKPLATVTGYWISAFVGLIPYPYEFHLNSREVKRLLLLPLEGFCKPRRWSTGDYTYNNTTTIPVCYWKHRRTVIWGATARLLLDLLQRLGENVFPGDREVPCVD